MAAQAQVQGHCDDKFANLRTLLQSKLDSGDECGLSLSVNIDGDDAVDLYGGFRDGARTQPWTADTIVNVWSTTKLITALSVLKLIDQGKIRSAEDKVSQYWPEFAQSGKEDVEIRHLLSHSSGVCGWDDPLSMEDFCNKPPQENAAKLAAQPPQWPPGTASAYHAWTYGFLLGEVVRRVTGGLSLKEFVGKEIADVCDGADFQIGCQEKDFGRVAELLSPPTPDLPPAPPGSLVLKMMNPFPDIPAGNTVMWRSAEIGAANGHSNAKGLNKILRRVTLAGKERDGELIGKGTQDLIFQEQTRGMDLCTGMTFRQGIGAALRLDGGSVLDDWLPPGKVCVWGGWGGSMGIMDVERGVTIAYAMNKMSGEGPVTGLLRGYLKEIYGALGVEW